ncbi:MAG TPA: DUF5666 domain-containing protein [Rhodocyclaceae bacterium]|nr:DUF5666 domain-containing protein [Rhodocyclaceae bacterium]
MISKLSQRLAALLFIATLSGCGAGGGAALLAGVGSGGTGLVAGIVTGFGSVIIDGSRYPDASASYDVTGDSSAAQAISRTQVGIGERAEVDTDASGNATAVHIVPEVIGVVSAISAPTNSLTVAGTRVVVNASDPTLPITVYDGYTQFSDIQVNDRVEVHGLPHTDALGSYVAATRIELKPSVCTGGCPVRVSGTVSKLSPNATSFSLGDLTVNVGATTTITPAGQSLANGERVSAFSSAPLSGTGMNADAIAIRKLSTSASAVGTLRLSGEIGNYVSNASFSVHGVSVNASAATLSPASLSLANEVDVIVAGSFDPATNVLTATSVSQYDSDTIQAELHGTVSNFVSAANFQVRGVLVDASTASFTGGSSANLQNNAYVEIHGRVSNNVVLASTVNIQSVQGATDGSVGDLRGVVSNFNATSNAFTLTLDNENGSQIQAVLAASPFFVGGTRADLINGKYVSLNAALVGGQWQVDTVTFMLASAPSGGGEGMGGQDMHREMEGVISQLSGNTCSVNGITVDFSAATISGGQPANGAQVQVYGTMSGSGSAMSLIASKLEIDD